MLQTRHNPAAQDGYVGIPGPLAHHPLLQRAHHWSIRIMIARYPWSDESPPTSTATQVSSVGGSCAPVDTSTLLLILACLLYPHSGSMWLSLHTFRSICSSSQRATTAPSTHCRGCAGLTNFHYVGEPVLEKSQRKSIANKRNRIRKPTSNHGYPPCNQHV